MASVLFGVDPLDPVTFAAVPLVLLAAALVASYVPARRAAAIAPVEALEGRVDGARPASGGSGIPEPLQRHGRFGAGGSPSHAPKSLTSFD